MLRLRHERKRLGLSLTRLSVKTDGIAASDLSRVERGLMPAFPGWQARIAKALNLPKEHLFALADESDANGTGAAA